MSTESKAVSLGARLDALTTPGARRIIGVVSFALLTALGAKLSVPIPGTAVPFTFQPLAVILTGAFLGARLGATSQIAYLLAGAIGMPVFATGAGAAYLLGPTGGYLLAYPFAAFIVGSLIGGRAIRDLFALLAGMVIVYAGGLAWLAILGGWSAAILLGALPFIAADLVKVVLALIVTTRLGARGRALFVP